MNKFFERFKKISLDDATFNVLCLIIFAMPLLFVPVLANWFDLAKPALLLVGTLFAGSLWLLRGALTKKLNLVRSPFDFPALVFVIIAVVSALMTVNRISNITADPALYLGSFLLFVLISQITSREEHFNTLVRVVLGSAALVSAWALIQMVVAILATTVKNPFLDLPFFSTTFSPTGSHLTQAMFLAAILPLAIANYLKGKKKFDGAVLAAIVLGLSTTLFAVYKSWPVLLSIETGWKISAGTMGRSLSSAIFGMGPANYIDAFTQYKPVEFNTTKFWNLRFTGGANFYFYLLSTVGIAGLAAFLLLASRLIKNFQKRLELPVTSPLEKGLIFSIGAILAAYLFLPGPAVLTVTLFALLGILVAHYNLIQNQAMAYHKTVNLSGILTFVPVVAVVLATLVSTFFFSRMVLADYYFGRSLAAAANNQGTQTYNLQIQAIGLNPYNDSYHMSYSQTNLAMADALASQPNLTDDQKAAVIQLVQQAIREARIAAALNPQRAGNWENLSLIYRSLINFAQGADQWTVASLNQAINLDPANPRLRLDLGGLYFAGKDYATAGQIFNQAANLKQDYANAHYNLAQALKGLGAKDQAASELQLAATLVCSLGKSADCDQVNQEIIDLGSAPATPSAETATTPVEPLATPGAQNKNLPKAKTAPPVKISSPSGEIQTQQPVVPPQEPVQP